MSRCLRSDCRYKAEEDADYGCDYAGQTGRTRLGQIYGAYGFDSFGRAAAYYADPVRCPFYEEREADEMKEQTREGSGAGLG